MVKLVFDTPSRTVSETDVYDTNCQGVLRGKIAPQREGISPCLCAQMRAAKGQRLPAEGHEMRRQSWEDLGKAAHEIPDGPT